MSDASHPPIPADGLAVLAHWDAEAGVWWAESPHLPGLVTEAPTIEALVERVRAVLPELLAANGTAPGVIQIIFQADRVETINLAA